MSLARERRAKVSAACARFRELYAESARFQEDKQLAALLEGEIEPVLEALVSACDGQPPPHDLHDVHAQLTRLCRQLAQEGATASVVVTLPAALAQAVHEVSVELSPAALQQLAIVVAEAYCAGAEERVARSLRQRAAESQVAVTLAPRCRAIFLAGQHDEVDLAPVLDRLARELLHDDVVSCLLDLRGLATPMDEELSRVIGGFCAQASTLGVQLVVVSEDAALRERFERWAVTGPTTQLVDAYDRGQGLALAAAGLQLSPRRRWTRLFLPDREGLVR